MNIPHNAGQAKPHFTLNRYPRGQNHGDPLDRDLGQGKTTSGLSR
jgi:hypothetical protein